MDESTKNGIIKAIVLMVLAALVVGGFFFLLNRGNNDSNNTTEEKVLTEVEKITTTDLSKTYPKTPATVVDLYTKIMQVMYKQTYTDEEFDKMAAVMAGIFDNDFLANQANWPEGLRTEVNNKKEGDYSISKYEILSQDEEKTTDSGEQISNVMARISLRHGTKTTLYNYLFVLRKDSEGRWKIMGWTSQEATE